MIQLRRNNPQDTPQLRQLWQTVFGDTDAYLDLFFAYYGQPGEAVLLEQDGTVVSALYLLPVGDLWSTGDTMLPFCYSYALATAPASRKKGYGTQAHMELIRTQRIDGFAYSGHCIEEERLFATYQKTGGFNDCFYLREATLSSVPVNCNLTALRSAKPEDYNAFRNRFLQERAQVFLRFHNKTIAYQKGLAQLAGGDLYLLSSSVSDPVWGCALIETDEDGTVLIKELLCPENRSMDALASIAKAYPAKQYLVRGPAEMHNAFDGTVRRCGQALRLDGGPALQTDGLGYYGLMFD